MQANTVAATWESSLSSWKRAGDPPNHRGLGISSQHCFGEYSGVGGRAKCQLWRVYVFLKGEILKDFKIVQQLAAVPFNHYTPTLSHQRPLGYSPVIPGYALFEYLAYLHVFLSPLIRSHQTGEPH